MVLAAAVNQLSRTLISLMDGCHAYSPFAVAMRACHLFFLMDFGYIGKCVHKASFQVKFCLFSSFTLRLSMKARTARSPVFDQPCRACISREHCSYSSSLCLGISTVLGLEICLLTLAIFKFGTHDSPPLSFF